jgi:hypothetical protein
MWTGRDGKACHSFLVDLSEPLRDQVQTAVLTAHEEATVNAR